MPNPPWQGDMNILFEREPGGDLCIQKNSKMVCIGLSLGSYGGGAVSALGNLTMHLDVG